jgi:hypothetical protein
MPVHEHHVVSFGPGRLSEVSAAVAASGRAAVEERGGRLFGLWKALIGLSLNHLVVLTEWADEAAARANAGTIIHGIDGLTIEQHDVWVPTLRPLPGAQPRSEPGFVTHRWYDIRAGDLDQFLELSANTWGNWEGVHDAEVIGLWRTVKPPALGLIRMRLMAWYLDMSAWERSRHWKGTKGAETANRNLGARYGLTLDSAVSILQPVA